MAFVAGQKRKIEYQGSGTPAQARKRQKGKDARAIPTQTADAALSTNGELNITSFVKAREFEIAALESSMKKARKSLAARAFQQVPRHMRRRTASHNVKKIPRRLRNRAAREILEDNTPTGAARKKKPTAKMRLRLETARKLQKMNARRKTLRQKKREANINAKQSDPEKHVSIPKVIPRIKKNKLADPPRATSKFKRRQVNKTWLPTHLWHAKRAHMTRPTLPLWKMAIPLSPTEKTYRATHRASNTRGCIAWDTSYISTIGCQGTDTTLEKMLKMLGFAGEKWSGPKYSRWKAGTRHSEGWVFEQTHEKRMICSATILWQKSVPEPITEQPQMQDVGDAASTEAKTKIKLNRKLLIRVHPSAFHQFWIELLKAAKAQKPQVLVEDLRFEVGSIQVSGPASTEVVVAVSRLVDPHHEVQKLWSILPRLSDPAMLPANAILSGDIYDSRLSHPPKQLKVRHDDAGANESNEAIVNWWPDGDKKPSRLFDQKARYQSIRQLPSQKSISRRRRDLLPGQLLEPDGNDPHIPALFLVERLSTNDRSSHGSWTMLLPWSCVDTIWRSLMYYPLTSGNTPRFGGLDQTRQTAFEHSIPWFPADYPGSEAGKAWERTEAGKRFDDWTRRPPAKRFSWQAIDLGYHRKGEHGRGWACDWEYLFSGSVPGTGGASSDTVSGSEKPADAVPLTQRQRNGVKKLETADEEIGKDTNALKDSDYTHATPRQASAIIRAGADSDPDNRHILATVRFSFLTRGTPKPGARLYRLPVLAAQEAVRNGATSNKQASAHEQEQILREPANVTSLPVNPSLFTHKSPPQYDAQILRQRWLKQDPQEASLNPGSSSAMPNQMTKEHRNRFGDVSKHQVYDSTHAMDLSHIRVFPPRTENKEILNMFGPKPPPRTEEQLQKVHQPQTVPKMIVKDGELVEESLWEKHVPCPGAQDLLGFVTTAGYNLSEGKGTGIGSIWLQRLLDGWKAEHMAADVEEGSSYPGPGQPPRASGPASKIQQQRLKALDRQRRLCVVRNPGESVGRLALWELC